MTVIDLLKRLTRERTQDLVVVPLTERHGAPARGVIEADTSYVTVRLKAARIVDVRRWTSRFYGCIDCRARLLDEASGLVEHHTVMAPADLKELDPANLDRVVQIDKVLLGPVPYRGRLDLTVALFSVKSADLAAPYIDLLTSLADTAGVAFLAAAKPYVEPLRKGADLLFGNAQASQLEIGFDRDFADLETGFHLAMRAPKAEVAVDKLRIDPNDFRLVDEAGKPFGQYPYFVLSIEATSRRPDWILIPDLNQTWGMLKKAFVEEKFNDAGNLLGQFERQCRVSSDLVAVDVQRLIGKARDTFAAGQAGNFGPDRGNQAKEFPAFDELNLYS